MTDKLHIDGSQGEGGGQTLRTSVSLAALLKRPLHVTKVRAGRPRPGLRREHLVALQAVAEISQGELRGAELNASEFHFEPGDVRAGEYRFSECTGDSACLVFQTVLWPLLYAQGDSRVIFEGGTHNPSAPSFDFLERCFLPLLRRMGARVDLRLERHGFAPAGGGRFVADIQGGCKLTGIELRQAGSLQSRQATALVCNLPGTIAIRELRELRELLEWKNEECLPKVFDESDGPGNVLLLEMNYEHVSEVISIIGERHLSAEEVAAQAAGELERYLADGVPVGSFLADQVLIPFALAGEGCFRTGPLSGHALTTIELLRRFLDTKIEQQDLGDSTLVSFSKPS